MEQIEHEKLAAADERMWWFRGLQSNLVTAFRRAGGSERSGTPVAVLDAGCGTGGLLAHLAAELPGADAFGLDLAPLACRIARQKSGRPVCLGSVDALPFADASFAAIFSADVLCHGGVDEHATLAGFHRCLAPGGILLLNLPAYPWLFSAHDVAVDNVRRYSRDGIRRLLRSAGFRERRLLYWNSWLFPLMVARRKLGRRRGAGEAGASDVSLLPAPLEALFGAVMRLENMALARGLALPFGGSIIAVAEKPA